MTQADGSFKTDHGSVCPTPKTCTQSPTVQVPVTENVQQTYQVQVPYTADGKLIEKSDYGKYGLKDNGRRGSDLDLERERLAVPPVIQKALVLVTDGHPSGDPSDSATGSETIDLPDADTWREQQLRRAQYSEFRLDGGKQGELESSKSESFLHGLESVKSASVYPYGEMGLTESESTSSPVKGKNDKSAEANKSVNGIIGQFRKDRDLTARLTGLPAEPLAGKANQLSGRSNDVDESAPSVDLESLVSQSELAFLVTKNDYCS